MKGLTRTSEETLPPNAGLHLRAQVSDGKAVCWSRPASSTDPDLDTFSGCVCKINTFKKKDVSG